MILMIMCFMIMEIEKIFVALSQFLLTHKKIISIVCATHIEVKSLHVALYNSRNV